MDKSVPASSEPSSATSRLPSLKLMGEEEFYARGIDPEYLKPIDYDYCTDEVSHPCGDTLMVSMKVDSGIITGMAHNTEGCCLTKATIDLLCEACVGHPVSCLLELQSKDLISFPISMGRRDCVEICFRALRNLHGQAQVAKDARA